MTAPEHSTSSGESASQTGKAAESDWTVRLYDELRALASYYLQAERANHSLQPTALVHEAFLRLADLREAGESGAMDQTSFKALAATVMRHVLVDHARRKASAKRGGKWLKITLDEAIASAAERNLDLLALEEAMTALAHHDERKCRVIELRFFGGLTCDQIARVLSIAPKTAEADWYMGRAWLRQYLEKGST